MKVLIVDHDPAVLEAAERALLGLIDSVQVTGKSACLARLREGGIDIVVACERLDDGSGLDLLATLGMTAPDVLRIFAADAERLKKLGAHLAPFKLFDTIGYPLDSMQLRSAMALAIAERGDLLSGEFENIVLGEDEPAASDDAPEAPPAIDALPQIVLLTRDLASLDTAKSALANKAYRVIAARDAGEARADLVTRQPVLALVDVGALGMDPVNWFIEAHRASPGTVLLALGRRNDGQMLEGLITGGTVNRFVAKPVTLAGMRLVLDSALRLQSLNVARANPAPPVPKASTPVDDSFFDDLHGATIAGNPADLATVDWQPPGGARPSGSGVGSFTPRAARPPGTASRLLLPTVLIAGTLFAFGAAWLYFSRASTPAAVPTPAAAPHTSPAPPTADELVARVEQALTQDDVSAARTAVEALQRVDADHPRAALLATLVTRAEETRRLAHAPAPQASNPSRAGAPTGAAVPPPTEATPAPAPTPEPTADAPGTTASPTDALPDPPSRTPAETAPNTSSLATRPAATPTDLRPSKLTAVSFTGRTIEAAGAGAEAPEKVPAPIPASRDQRAPPVVMEMKLLRSVQPEYPSEARRRGIEGAVELQFTVGSNGRVSDVAVVSSTPPGVFDAEATAAVKRWRYDARREDGVPVAAPTNVRLEFKLDE